MYKNKLLKCYRMMEIGCLNSQIYNISSVFNLQKRRICIFMEWFIKLNNWPDSSRLKLMGPDCVCAEWALRNSASVRFKGETTLISDYNELMLIEETEPEIIKVEEVYGEGANLHDIGFHHFENCKYVKKVTLISCSYVGNLALFKLRHIKDSLKYLEIRSCRRVKDKGLHDLCLLSNLEELILADLPSVRNKAECEMALKTALPKCRISF